MQHAQWPIRYSASQPPERLRKENRLVRAGSIQHVLILGQNERNTSKITSFHVKQRKDS